MNKNSKNQIDLAIKTYQSYLIEIDTLTENNYIPWIAKVSDSTKKYIGESALLETINNMDFCSYHTINLPPQNDNSYLGRSYGRTKRTKVFNSKGEKQHAKTIMQSCIEYIKVHGILESNKKGSNNSRLYNFFFNRWEGLVSIAITIIVLSFSIGYYFGTEKVDLDKIKLENKLDELNKRNESLSKTNQKLIQSCK